MEYIANHWYVILLAGTLLAYCIYELRGFLKNSKEERYEQVRAWLLQAVMLAEREYGSGTGKLKLSAVYAEFCTQLPWIAKIIPFHTFSEWVDVALAEMREILSKNDAIANIVEKI